MHRGMHHAGCYEPSGHSNGDESFRAAKHSRRCRLLFDQAEALRQPPWSFPPARRASSSRRIRTLRSATPRKYSASCSSWVRTSMNSTSWWSVIARGSGKESTGSERVRLRRLDPTRERNQRPLAKMIAVGHGAVAVLVVGSDARNRRSNRYAQRHPRNAPRHSAVLVYRSHP
jgi:hypothetical protein